MNTPTGPAPLPNNEGGSHRPSAEEMLKSFHSPLFMYLVEVLLRALLEWQEIGASRESDA